MTCRTCGQRVPPDSRFCPQCGVTIRPASPAPGDERRIITAVFCDLVGSTALSEALDAETLRSVILRYYDVMRGRILPRGGTVEKFIGDAVMAVFGIPEIHEDDATRALAAALDMIAALDELNADLEQAFSLRLQVRIGVNTGEVIAAADVTSGHALVSGEVINLAARLEQSAPPGQILIGQDTLRAAGNAVAVTDAGLLTLHGKSAPFQAYRLLGIRGDAPELTRRFDTSFVGRQAELAQLSLLLARVTERGESHLVTVFGDAGIGKTRLAREWLAGIAGQATLVGMARCRADTDSGGTLTPLADVMRQLPSGGSPAQALALLESGLLRDGTPNPSADDTCAALTQVLADLARERAVVVVIDDCQWASGTLLDILDQVRQNLAFEPFMVLCLARPDLIDIRPSWGGGQLNSSSLILPRLSAAESAELAEGLTGIAIRDAAFPASVLDRSEGNPLHLEQLIGALAETGDPRKLPLTLQALLSARVNALSACQRTVLQIASVIGREFTIDDVQRLLERDPGGCGRADHMREVRALVRHRLIEPVRHQETDQPGYRFSSGLIHETVYCGMVKRVRAERHERLASLGKADGAALATVGSHLEAAFRHRADLGLLDERTESLRQRAVACLTTAGTAALARSDLGWASDMLERALALSARPQPSWPQTARQAGEVRLALGRVAEARELLREVLAESAAREDAGTVMHARLDLAVIDPDADISTLAGLATQALPVFTALNDSLGIAKASIRIAQHYQFQGSHTAATKLLGTAIDHAIQAQAEPERAMALGTLGVSLWHGPIHAAQAVARCEALLAEHGERRAVRLSLSCPLAVLHALHGDFSRAARRLTVAEEIGRSTGHAEAAVVMPFFSAAVAALAGRDKDAESLLRQALAATRGCGDIGMLGAVKLDLARLLTGRGAIEEADTLLSALGTVLPPSVGADTCAIRARIAAQRGNADEALCLAQEALAIARRTDSPVLLATCHLDDAHVHALAGRSQQAREAAVWAGLLYDRKGHVAGARWASQLAARGATP